MDVYTSAWAKLARSLVWQEQYQNHWHLGVPVRGLVRTSYGDVWPDGHFGWLWAVPSLNLSGLVGNFLFAIELVEKALNIHNDVIPEL